MSQRQLSIAKITRPRTAGAYERKRLFDLLDRHSDKPVIWISGPAGSGKTTLVGTYLDSRKLPCLWYQIDEGDGDIGTFFYYMGLAAKKAAPRIKRPFPPFTPEYASDIPIFTRRFFESLYSRLPFPSVLVFDNYQCIPESSPLIEVMKTAFSIIPEGIKIIIISRAGPPPAFTALWANNQLDMIGWDDLRLTPEESQAIVRLEGGTQLSAEDAGRIYERAGGWAAGLILMAKAARREGIARTAATALPPEQIFDYLANELFNNQPDEVKDLLLRASLVPHITPGMAEELTGNHSAASILLQLNRRNYFTEKRFTPALTYQFHPLFRDFLISRAAKVFSPADMSGMRLQSARLLEQSGQLDAAAELYIEAKQWEALAGLALTSARELVSQGRTKTLLGWFTSLPPEMAEQSPWLLYWSGVCHFPVDYAACKRCFERAFRLFDGSGDRLGALLAWSAAVDTIVYEFGNLKQLGPWIAWFRQSEKKASSYPSPDVEYRAATSMAVALMFSGKGAEEITPWVERAMQLMHSVPDRNVQIQSSVYFAIFYLWHGEPATMGEILKDQKRWARLPGASPLSAAAVYYTQALHDWITADSDFGFTPASEGLALSAAHGIHQVDNHLIAQKLIGALAKSDLAMAEDLLRLIESITGGTEKRFLVNYHYFYLSAWKSLLAGEFSAACRESMDSLRLLDEMGGSCFHRAFINSMAAQALLSLGRNDEADKHIRTVKRMAAELDSPLLEWSGLLLEAQAFVARASSTASPQSEPWIRKGLKALKTALTLGKEKQYLNTFAWYPPAVTRLCLLALQHGIETDYARQLIRKHNLVPEEPPLHIENWPWPLKIYAFGTFRVERDGSPLAYSRKAPRKPLELLRLLVALGGNAREGRIMEALWPDAEGDAAQKSLSVTLARLREVLGVKEAVQVHEGTISLNERCVWTDARTFETMLGDAETRGSGVLEITELEKALELYRGPFLEGEEQAWPIRPRERFRELYLRAVETLGSHWEKNREWRKAIEVYQKGLHTDDLVEKFHIGVMNCLLKLGSKAEALSAYRRLQKTLHAYGLEPSEQAASLYQKIVSKR